ncbi:HtaA domain-containing protein [Corynebacterium mendelii]|uniref:HtaA domain-containing protein n=1 Tax=Corynebacterium mendelii TaxID=2765362 RepID=A0A939ITQ1_9CORY|nr:HtaA domain-containing protein [Corynebacterium mendelii]MBN9644089.1 HtaA domain-containing protein [Corynebacterium mendelii]
MTFFAQPRLAKRLTAVLSGVAVAMGILATPATAETDQPPETDNAAITQITEGTVTWGFRESWRNYIGDGAQLYDGVTLNENKEYVWPIKSGTYNSETKALHLKLGGYIHNLAYCQPPDSYDNCTLDIIYKELEVDITEDKQQVTGIYEGNTRENTAEKVEMPRQAWGNFIVDEAKFSFENGETTIADAPGFIDSFPLYGKGAVADPLTIRYKGPGGLPEVEKRLGEPGKWKFKSAEEGTVLPGFPREGLDSYYDMSVFPIKGTDKVFLYQLTDKFEKTAHRKFWVVDTKEKKIEASYDLPFTPSTVRNGFVDPQYDGNQSFYFFLGLENEEDLKNNPIPRELARLSYKNGQFTLDKQLWKADSATILSLGWDHDSKSIIVAGDIKNRETPGTIYVIDPTTATPGQNDAEAKEHSLVLAATNLPDYKGAPTTATFPNSVGAPAVLGNGIYIFPSGDANRTNGKYENTDGTTSIYPPVWVNINEQMVGSDSAVGYFMTGVSVKKDRDQGGEQIRSWRQILPAGDSNFFTVGTGWSSIMNYASLTEEKLLGAIPVKNGKYNWEEPYVLFGAGSGPLAAYNEEAGYGVYYGRNVQLIAVFTKDGIQDEFFSPKLHKPWGSSQNIAMRDNGEVIYSGINKDKDLTIYTGRAYRYGDFATQPTDQTVDLGEQESASVTFTATVTEDTKDPKFQWQVKRKGESKFTDIADATKPTYTFDATSADADSTYRLLVETGAGWTASNEAALTVNWTPKATTPALPAKVNDGDTATFTATFNTPEGSTLGWKRYDKSTGLWQPITPDGSVFVIVTEGNTTTLTIKGVNTDMSGMKVQAYATSPAGVTTTSDSALTVTQPQEIPDEGVDITGVRFFWDVGGEVQSKPPFGGANYLSAGKSDGDEASYNSKEGNVRIVTGTAGDTMTEPTYATRAEFLSNGTNQFVEITDGKGHINKDKSGTISWEGAFSVNFYGGLVPFTITNPKLTIDADGTGTLVADLSGYGSDMNNPNEKTALDPQPNTVIARFTNASLQTDGTVTLTPLYSGVKVDTTGAERTQNTEAEGWGSWPQEFVNFQIKTGLSSYWYTSSASEKPGKKAPLPVTVDFDKAETTAPGEGGTEADDTDSGKDKDDDKQTSPAPNPGTGTGTGTADNGKVTVIINNQQPDDSNPLRAMLQATTALGSIIALVVSLQTAWMIIASMPGGIPAQLAKLFPPAPWQHPAPAPAPEPAPVAAG